jgi:hypothetical protein
MSERPSMENRQKELAEVRKELLRLIIKNEAYRRMKRFGELVASQSSS